MPGQEEDVYSTAQAVVSEGADGELSCSVEETNRLRALLGLKPLRVDGAPGAANKTAKEVDVRVDKAAVQTAADEAALRERIAAARERRRMEEAAATRGLGDVLRAEQGEVSAADWVRMSRAHVRVPAAQAAAARSTRVAAATEAHTAEGLLIRHDAEAFKTGETAVLTLADRGVLDDNGVAADADELEDVGIAREEAHTRAQERKARLKRPVYDGRDDEEFGAGGVGRKPYSMLSQYDEEAAPSASLRVGASGRVDSATAAEDVRRRLAEATRAKASGKILFSAAVDNANDTLREPRQSSEALVHTHTHTHAESMHTGSVPRTTAGAAAGSRRKQLRQRTDDADADDADAPIPSVTAEVVAAAQRDGAAGGGRDRGSRAARRNETTTVNGVQVSSATAEEVQRITEQHTAFQAALARASAHSQAVLGDGASTVSGSVSTVSDAQQAVTMAQVRSAAGEQVPDAAPAASAVSRPTVNAHTRQRVYTRLRQADDDDAGDADDADLNAVLARARRLAAGKPSGATAAPGVPDVAAVLPAAAEHDKMDAHAAFVASAVAERAAEVDMSAGAAAAEGADGEQMVFTDTMEFSRLLQSRLQQSADDRKAPGNEQTEAESLTEAVRRKRARYAAELLAAQDGAQVVEDTTNDADHMEEEEEPPSEDGGAEQEDAAPRADWGVGGVLGLLKERGDLRVKDVFKGRSGDARYDDTLDEVFDLRDEHGNKLTIKEEYRRLSWAFHGRMPSQKTRSKRHEQFLRERKSTTGVSRTAATSALTMQRAQEATGQAFFKL